MNRRNGFLCLAILIAGAALFAPAAAAAEVTGDQWYQAIRANDVEKIRGWIASGADVNAKGARGVTPLMIAAQIGSVEAVKTLVSAKADVNAKNAFDGAALLFAAGNYEKARILIEAGADVNARSKQGQIPIVVASLHSGNIETVKLMIAKGADPTARGAFGSTALTSALLVNDLPLAKLLIEGGAKVSDSGRRLATKEALEKAPDAGSAANQADGGGFTALHYAAGAGNLEAVKMLLAKGANVNAVNTFSGIVKNGPIGLVKLTPLMLAAPFGSPELVKTLLDAGADVNAQDVRGMTALMLAVASENQDQRVIKMLLDRGADPKIKSKSGETALDWAQKFGSPKVISSLGGSPARIQPVANAPVALSAAVAKSIALLENSSQKFFTEGGCAGCHHTNMTSIAAGVARKHGVALNEAAAAERVKQMKTQFQGQMEFLYQRIDPPGAPDTVMYAAMALASEKYPADAVIDAMVSNLANEQLSTGNWGQIGIARAPMEESDIHRTALAARVLALYPIPARKAEFDERIAKARSWLEAAKPRSTDDLAMLAAGLKRTGSSDAKVQAAVRALAGAQRSDGGWGPNANLASDAYHTGQALHVLHELGALKPGADAFTKASAFLLRTQREDGSWYVKSRSPKFQPYFESGFPHGHDQWISAAGTAWAVIGLMPSVKAQPSRAARE